VFDLNTDIVRKLIDILKGEADVYRNILDMGRKKTDVIVEGRIQELEAILKVEQKLIGKIAIIENNREETAENLAAELGLNTKNNGINEILTHLDVKQANELEKNRENMINIFDEIKKINELNARLIKNSLDYIDFSINLLADAGLNNDSGNYNSSGETGNSISKRNFIDAKL
jgi:hypothetical protein